jgi:hypothetical protein
MAAIMAALLFLQLPIVFAGSSSEEDPCSSDPESCLIPLPQSVQVNPRGIRGAAELGSYTDPGIFVPAGMSVAMPNFVAASSPPAEPAPSFSTLPITLRYQDPADVSCGVQALGMAMEGVAGPAPSSAAILSFLQDAGMMYEFGTGVEELTYAAQYYGYTQSAAFHGWTVAQLMTEVSAGRPVVVALGSNGPDVPGHFVTVTGFSHDGFWVAYHDPILGSRVVPVADFNQLWKLQGYSGVSVIKAAVAVQKADMAPVAAGAAALMAVVALAPMGTKRKGIGGQLIIDAGISSNPPPHPAPIGYRWVPKQLPIYETRTVQDGWTLELKPRMVSKWRQVGWTETKLPIYRTVTIHDGWEYYYDRESYWTTKRYVRYYRTIRKPKYRYVRGRRRFAGYSYARKPVYGARRVRKTRTVRKRRPKWKTVKEFSHWFTKKEPKYGWVQEQDGWDETRTPKYVEKQVQVGKETKWELEIDPRFDIPVSDPSGSGKPASDLSPPGSNLNSPSWLTNATRPPWINAQLWQMLPYEDRLHVIEAETASFENWLEHVKTSGRSGVAKTEEWLTIRSGGKHLGVMNPLRIRSEPGVSSTVLAYVSQGKSLEWTGEVRRIGNYDWYEVTFTDPVMGHVSGWVNSFYLTADGKALAGDTVESLFEVLRDVSTVDQLLSVTANWLIMRDGPTTKYPKIAEIPWGRVMKLTGRYVNVDGSIWREAYYDGKLGWVADRYLTAYEAPAHLPAPEEGKVWVELNDKFSVSYYYVVDIDSYRPNENDPARFSEDYIIQWKDGGGPENTLAQHGALFGPAGVAMQGSGIIEINGERKWITLNNPGQLNWQDQDGNLVKWDQEAGAWLRQGDGARIKADQLEIMNPKDARFARGSIAENFVDFKTIAAAPELDGKTIAMPDLPGLPEGHDQIFYVEDGGGAFGRGETRFDLFISDYQVAKEWYSDSYEGPDGGRLSTTVFIQQDLSPKSEE